VCVVYPDNAGGFFLGNIEEYAGSGSVITGQVWGVSVCGHGCM